MVQTTQLYGLDIRSDTPVVVFLDTSESLKSQHDAVATEIRRLFPAASVVEINGVVFGTRASIERLKQNSNYSSYLADYYLTLVDGSIIPRVTAQIQNNEVPAAFSIYYFSDFEDYVERKDVEEFSRLLQAHHVRFYAHSVEKEPEESIRQMCVDTAGGWTVREVKDH